MSWENGVACGWRCDRCGGELILMSGGVRCRDCRISEKTMGKGARK